MEEAKYVILAHRSDWSNIGTQLPKHAKRLYSLPSQRPVTDVFQISCPVYKLHHFEPIVLQERKGSKNGLVVMLYY